MNYIIRQAKPSDSTKIAPLIYDAIGDIAFRLTGENDISKMFLKLEKLVEGENNRHSYMNTHVIDSGGEILGMIVLYDGESGNSLDRKLEKSIFEQYGVEIKIDVEAHEDEYYIDTVCVANNQRGHGFGTTLLRFAEKEAKLHGYKKLSLNVEEQKVRAQQLYLKMGFVATEPWTIIDEPFIHMVKEI